MVRLLARVGMAPLLVVAAVQGGCNALSGAGDMTVGDDIDVADAEPANTNNADGPIQSSPGPTGADAAQEADSKVASDAKTTDAPTTDGTATDAKPVDANPPDVTSIPTKRVFASSGQLTGNMGGVAGGDNLCAQAAADAGLGGTWVAWLSTTKKEAIDRITFDGHYVRMDGLEVVANKAQLANSNLTNPISLTEHNLPVDPDGTATKNIWTGRNATNSNGSSCNDWTTNNSLSFGSRGHSGSTATPNWTQVAGFANGGWGCQTLLSVYCFEL